MPLPSNQLFPDAPVENVIGFAHAGFFIERHSFDAVIGEAILNVDIAPRDWEVITLEDDTSLRALYGVLPRDGSVRTTKT